MSTYLHTFVLTRAQMLNIDVAPRFQAARQAAKAREVKAREAILNQRKKKEVARGMGARQDIEYNIGGSGGGGSSYKPVHPAV